MEKTPFLSAKNRPDGCLAFPSRKWWRKIAKFDKQESLKHFTAFYTLIKAETLHTTQIQTSNIFESEHLSNSWYVANQNKPETCPLKKKKLFGGERKIVNEPGNCRV